jgi:ankyrin repeat protein
MPIHYAAMDVNAKDIEACLAAGDDVNIQDELGFTPLHMAAQHQCRAAAQLLLERGADVDRPNISGNTPLFVAVFTSKGNGELITLLRERGADPRHANKTGQTPIGLAQLIRNYDVARFFSDLLA